MQAAHLLSPTLLLLMVCLISVSCEDRADAEPPVPPDNAATPQAQAPAQPAAEPSPPPQAAAAPSAADLADAKALYQQQCALCHMDDGSGVPDLQPPLAGSAIVNRESPDAVIQSILMGSQAPDAGGDWGNPMPGYPDFSNRQIAGLATYIRTHFGNNAPAVTPGDVARLREEM
jgi:mono/diheme cytochrome c family protein